MNTTGLAGVISSDDQAILMFDKKLQNFVEQDTIEFEIEEDNPKEILEEQEQEPEIVLKEQVNGSVEDVRNLELDETAGDDWHIPISSSEKTNQSNDIDSSSLGSPTTIPPTAGARLNPAALDAIREID